MLLGPTFSAEMVTSARRARYFLLRVVYGASLFMLLWIIYGTVLLIGGAVPISERAQLASRFFHSFIWLQMLAVLALGPAMAGSSIARERERRTLEYLLASRLTNSEIVLGKLTAGLLKLMFALLVGLPILALAMLMGGIGPGELLAAFVFTLSTMFATSALSVAVSTRAARAREAVVRTYVLLVALLLLPVIVANIPYLARFPWIAQWMQPLIHANPFWALVTIERSTGQVGSAAGWSFVLQLVRNQAIFATVCIVWAVWGVRRAYLKAAGVTKRPQTWRLPRLVRFRLGRNPMIWKELQVDQSGGKRSIIAIFAVSIVLLLTCGLVVREFAGVVGSSNLELIDDFIEQVNACATALSCIALLIIAVRAAGAVSGERERETWATLLTTPLAARQIVTAKLLGSIYSVRRIAVAVALIWVMGIIVMPEFAVSLPGVVANMALLSLFAAGLGLIFSLWCKSSTRAMIWTLVISLFLAGGYWLFAGFLLVPLALLGAGNETMSQIVWVLMLAPLIPYLVGFSYELRGLDLSGRSDEWFIGTDTHQLITYVVGNLGYLALTFMILWFCYRRFERFTGRTDYAGARRRRSYRETPRVEPIGEAELQASAVEQ